MQDTFKIHVIEDDAWFGELLKYHLSQNPDNDVNLFKTGTECIEGLKNNPDLVTIDYDLPDVKGDQLLEKIREKNPDLPVIIISGQEDVSTAISLLKMGVQDYFVKDDNTKDLVWNAVNRIKETSDLKEEVKELRAQLNDKFEFDNLIKGTSPQIQQLFDLMRKAAKTNINVSITGETGTGKELVAQAIHFNGSRKKKKFVPVNMGAIPKELVESELFGYEKGAFTGATNSKAGKFEEANGGTIFLDEIAELPMPIQTKLLRVLQEREVVRLGSNKPISLEFRLIVATHKDLSQEVKKGNFREDLFYRIVGLPISVPPLRERGNDIIVLADHFLNTFCEQNNLPAPKIEDAAINKLLKHPFPGNVRELKSVVELAAIMTDNGHIKRDDITFNEVSSNGFSVSGIEKPLKEYNKEIIKHYLDKYNNNVLLVAKKLEVGKSTIYNMLKRGEI